jgi:hypothetical protein
VGTSDLVEYTVSIDPAGGCNSYNSVATHCTVQCLFSNKNVTNSKYVAPESCTIVGRKDMEGRFGRAGFIRRDRAKPEKTQNRGYSVSSLIFKWCISLQTSNAWDWANLFGIQGAITQNNTIICVCVCVCLPTYPLQQWNCPVINYCGRIFWCDCIPYFLSDLFICSSLFYVHMNIGAESKSVSQSKNGYSCQHHTNRYTLNKSENQSLRKNLSHPLYKFSWLLSWHSWLEEIKRYKTGEKIGV